MTSIRTAPTAPPTGAHDVAAEIDRLMALRSTRAAAFGSHFAALWEHAVHCMRGGKLLRPRLLLGAFDSLAGPGPGADSQRRAAVELAAALEILHFSFLLHDDLIDGDLIRRGEPNLVGRLLGESPEEATDPAPSLEQRMHWARSSTLLIGDFMLSIAHQVFARAELPHAQRIRVLDLLDLAVTETVAGEHCDVGLSARLIDPDLGLVLEMTRMKTATYTFELPLRIAAVLAGVPASAERQLGEAGRHLGVAFQLQDDLLSAFAPSRSHGKDQFSDFREGKETALIAYARISDAWPRIERLLCDAEFTEESGRAVQHLLHECGARGFIESSVQDRFAAAVGVLRCDDGGLPASASDFILSLIDALDGRRK